MKNDREEHLAYVYEVRENTRRHLDALISENEALRTRISDLENTELQLQNQVSAAKAALALRVAEKEDLKRRFDEQEEQRLRLAIDQAGIEEQNNNLANLYVATYSLHGTLDRDELLAVIQEIVSNLIGSEEMAIFERSADGSKLFLVASMGIDEQLFQTVAVGEGVIGQTVCAGEAYLSNRQSSTCPLPHESGLTACLPLKVSGEVTGAIAVFGLLEQKSGLEPIDIELFDLLASQAAMALYCTRLHAQSSAALRAAAP